ncbi:glycosyl transferase family 1 [Thioclava sp. ES.031]|uniref:glycosyltransferase family protein n=1 Tax=Thioclava sp. ES.031 TaxID=1798203 RepID=UPI000C018B43|nr:glycosyltransferase [Thioclava sp. ES.031]PFG62457.1 glycosyl transferase family 1 [Thioclava sp. ES.031]
MAEVNYPPRINVLLPCSRPSKGRFWGDHYFGQSLARALRDLGAEVWVGYRGKAVHMPHLRRGIDLVIRGKRGHSSLWRSQYLWVISQHERISDADLRRARHVFSASSSYAEELQGRGISASWLPQCTDRYVFSPDHARADLAREVISVGNLRGAYRREIVSACIADGLPLKIWGMNWKGAVPDENLGGRHIPNSELGAYYASAKVVLNDHEPQMARGHFASNRVYDVLASGATLVTDCIDGIPEDLRRHVYGYVGAESAPVAVREALEAPRGSNEIAEHVLQNHSFHNRAMQILQTVAPTFAASVPFKGVVSKLPVATACLSMMALAACGPIPVEQAEAQCYARYAPKSPVSGEAGMGVTNDGFRSNLKVELNVGTYVQGDPSSAYDTCVYRKSGRMPTRPLYSY